MRVSRADRPLSVLFAALISMLGWESTDAFVFHGSAQNVTAASAERLRAMGCG